MRSPDCPDVTKSACSTDDETVQWRQCGTLGSVSALDDTEADTTTTTTTITPAAGDAPAARDEAFSVTPETVPATVPAAVPAADTSGTSSGTSSGFPCDCIEAPACGGNKAATCRDDGAFPGKGWCYVRSPDCPGVTKGGCTSVDLYWKQCNDETSTSAIDAAVTPTTTTTTTAAAEYEAPVAVAASDGDESDGVKTVAESEATPVAQGNEPAECVEEETRDASAAGAQGFCTVLAQALKATVASDGVVDTTMTCMALQDFVSEATCPQLLEVLMKRIKTDGVDPSKFPSHQCYIVAVSSSIAKLCDATMAQIHERDTGGAASAPGAEVQGAGAPRGDVAVPGTAVQGEAAAPQYSDASYGPIPATSSYSDSSLIEHTDASDDGIGDVADTISVPDDDSGIETDDGNSEDYSGGSSAFGTDDGEDGNGEDASWSGEDDDAD